MQPIGYFLLLFSSISTNMISSMDFFTQEEQRCPKTPVDYYASPKYAQAVADFYAKQNHPPAQTRQYAQSVAQRYAEQQHAQAAEQRYPQPQFRPHVNVVHNHSTSSHWPQPLINISINFSELPPNLSNPNRPYDFQLQEKRDNKSKLFEKTATILVKLRNSTSPNTTQELPPPRNPDNFTDFKFTLRCPHCNQKFVNNHKSGIKRAFTNHTKIKKHPLTEEKIENCINNVNEPKKQ